MPTSGSISYRRRLPGIYDEPEKEAPVEKCVLDPFDFIPLSAMSKLSKFSKLAKLKNAGDYIPEKPLEGTIPIDANKIANILFNAEDAKLKASSFPYKYRIPSPNEKEKERLAYKIYKAAQKTFDITDEIYGKEATNTAVNMAGRKTKEMGMSEIDRLAKILGTTKSRSEYDMANEQMDKVIKYMSQPDIDEVASQLNKNYRKEIVENASDELMKVYDSLNKKHPDVVDIKTRSVTPGKSVYERLTKRLDPADQIMKKEIDEGLEALIDTIRNTPLD